jgi:hypothetical protein
MEIQPYGDNFIPVVPVDHAVHTPDTPFCPDPECPCKEDQEAIGKVHQAYLDGIITEQDATDIVMGGKQW